MPGSAVRLTAIFGGSRLGRQVSIIPITLYFVITGVRAATVCMNDH